MTIKAVVENGMLKPLEDLKLPDGKIVRIVVLDEKRTVIPLQRTPAEVLAVFDAIAALPREGSIEPLDLSDLDKEIYKNP